MEDYTGFALFILFDKVAQRLIGKSTKKLCMDKAHTVYISYFNHPINYLTLSSRVFLFVQKDDDSTVSLKIKKNYKKNYIFQIKVNKYNLKQRGISYTVLKIVSNDTYNELESKRNRGKSIVSDIFLFFYI